MGRVVTHIVPYFAPTIDGVGDYALNLARHLRGAHGWNSRFLVADANWSGPERVEEFAVAKTANAQTLATHLDGVETALLHYVGYGYQKRGVPLWLAKGMRLSSPCRLVTVFHEIWSAGRPWQSAFYLSTIQKNLVKKFLARSSRAFISTRAALGELEKIGAGIAQWLPIPSNLPAPSQVAVRNRSGEKWTVLIFGQPHTRIRAADRNRPLLAELAEYDALEKVLVAGKDARGLSNPSADVSHLRTFVADSKIHVVGEVKDASIFGQADIYLSSHWACNSCKSGALMAALSAGCPALVVDDSDPAPLAFDRELLQCDGTPEAVEQLIRKKRDGVLDRVGAAGREWFLKNANWQIIAAKIAAALAAR